MHTTGTFILYPFTGTADVLTGVLLLGGRLGKMVLLKLTLIISCLPPGMHVSCSPALIRLILHFKIKHRQLCSRLLRDNIWNGSGEIPSTMNSYQLWYWTLTTQENLMLTMFSPPLCLWNDPFLVSIDRNQWSKTFKTPWFEVCAWKTLQQPRNNQIILFNCACYMLQFRSTYFCLDLHLWNVVIQKMTFLYSISTSDQL